MNKYTTRDLTASDSAPSTAYLVDGKWYFRVVLAHCVKHYAVTGTFCGERRMQIGERLLNPVRCRKLIAQIDAAYGGPAKTLAQQGKSVGFSI